MPSHIPSTQAAEDESFRTIIAEYRDFLSRQAMAPSSIESFLGRSRHFLGLVEQEWPRSLGGRRRGLGTFPDPRVHVFGRACGRAKRSPAAHTPGASSSRVMTFVRFLELSGRATTPGELEDNLALVPAFLHELRGKATHNLGSTCTGAGRPHSSPGCICRGCVCATSIPTRSRSSITGASRAPFRVSAGADARGRGAATAATFDGFWTISQTPSRSSPGVPPSGRTGSASRGSVPGSLAPETSAPGASTSTSNRSRWSCPPWESLPSRMMRR